MGVLKATIFLIGVLLVVTSVGANELGDATANPVSAYGSSDYSNLPARENLDQCSEEALSERQALQNSCLRDFSSRGLREAVRPNEMVQARSCDEIEPFSEVMLGCSKAILIDVIGAIPELVSSLTPHQRFSEEILESCGQRPYSETFRNSVLEVTTFSSPEELAETNAHLAVQRSYNQCARNAITQERARRRVRREQVELQIDGYRSRCRTEVLNARGNDQINECVLDFAEEENCEDCITELTSSVWDIPRTLVRTVWDDLRSSSSFQCFNRETQGRMVCSIIASVAGGAGAVASIGRHGARLVSRLPSDVRDGAARRAQALLGDTDLDGPLAGNADRGEVVLNDSELDDPFPVSNDPSDLSASEPHLDVSMVGRGPSIPDHPNLDIYDGVVRVNASLPNSSLTRFERVIRNLERRGITVRLDPNLRSGVRGEIEPTDPNTIRLNPSAFDLDSDADLVGVLHHEATHILTNRINLRALELSDNARRAFNGRNLRFRSLGPNSGFPRGYEAVFSSDEMEALSRGSVFSPRQSPPINGFSTAHRNLIPRFLSRPDSDFVLQGPITNGAQHLGYLVRIRGAELEGIPVFVEVPVSLRYGASEAEIVQEARVILERRFIRAADFESSAN